jgi:hypothetical protein
MPPDPPRIRHLHCQLSVYALRVSHDLEIGGLDRSAIHRENPGFNAPRLEQGQASHARGTSQRVLPIWRWNQTIGAEGPQARAGEIRSIALCLADDDIYRAPLPEGTLELS